MTQLPLLFLPDVVVLPGMVVPIELDESAQAADRRRPRQQRRPAAGRPAARGPLRVVRRRSPPSSRSAGSAAAPRPPCSRPSSRGRDRQRRDRPRRRAVGRGRRRSTSTSTDHARELAEEYKRLVVAVLQRREAWQVIDTVQPDDRPRARSPTRPATRRTSPTSASASCSRRPTSSSGSSASIEWTREHLAEVEVTDKIGDDVREGMEKSQREFLLRQQLAAIRKELGEGEPEGADDYRARVEAADVPEAVREALLREVDKLERSSDQSPEAGWIRTWLDTVLELPWSVTTEDTTDVDGRPRRARRRPPRPRRGQGADRRVPRRPRPPRRARPAGRRRPRLAAP